MIAYEFTLLHFKTFPIHTEQNKCHPNPCRNGGTCTGINEGEGFECTCREGFKGKNCEGSQLFFCLCSYEPLVTLVRKICFFYCALAQ